MKKLILIFAVVSLLFFGCQDENSLVEPNSNFKTENLSKHDKSSTLQLTTATIDNVQSHYSKTYTINGKRGGRISERHSWLDSNGNSIVLEATLTIPRNAFEGDLTFGITFDLENLSVELFPSPFTFNKPVLLDLLFEGVDLSGVDPNSMDFKYESPDGTSYNVVYESKVVESNYLEVVQAQLPHFSRYGWLR